MWIMNPFVESVKDHGAIEQSGNEATEEKHKKYGSEGSG